MDTTEHEDMILVAALVRFSHDYEQADEELAATAWGLAQGIAAEHGLSVKEAAMQVEPGR